MVIQWCIVESFDRETDGDANMSAIQASIKNIIAENEDYFVADLDNGGVRLGMFGVGMFDFLDSHADFAKVRALNIGDAEGLFDELYLRYI